MKEKAFDLAKAWTVNDYFDESDRQEIQDLLAEPEKNEAEIIDRFYQNLEFGTGGLRSIIGNGLNRINKYNIRRAAQAMATSLLKQNPTRPTACISYDNRRYSQEFAQTVASIFAANGVKAYIFKELTPTPLLSYAVRYYKAHCGVMITASHNPKQYNGLKAYWSDGAQVTPPQDQKIIDEYNALTDWSAIKIIDFEAGQASGLIKWVEDALFLEFYKHIETSSLNIDMCKQHGDKVHFIYTPLHGCGHIPCKSISKQMGFTKFEVVESQAEFDSNFSTLSSTPNPEDPEALQLAVALMKEKNADIAYATDPDCDRLGVVVNQKGLEHYLNGNQIAILMLHYLFSQKKEKGLLPQNPLVIKSIVTSSMQNTIAQAFGGTVIDTLTGFKWMARKLKDLEDESSEYNFVFASEESFGYMPNDNVRDKDAVAAIALMNEITLYYKMQDKTLIDALDDIYEEYGFAQESLIALNFEGLPGKEKIHRIMQYFRENFDQKIAGHQVKVFKDYSTGKALNLDSHETASIDMTPSNVLGLEFQSGHQLFIRPSGTEPKIKFYTMVQVKQGNLKEKKDKAQAIIDAVESFIHQKITNI